MPKIRCGKELALSFGHYCLYSCAVWAIESIWHTRENRELAGRKEKFGFDKFDKPFFTFLLSSVVILVPSDADCTLGQ
jgi:hypothetical protein